MPQFLVAIHHPADYEPFSDGPEVFHAVDALNEEMSAAGAIVFMGGLHSPRKAKTVRRQADGQSQLTDGPFIEAKEYVGGFWVLQARDMDAAMEWASKASAACRRPVEVRQFFGQEDVAEMVRAKGFVS